MMWSLSPEDQEFRDEVRRFLDAELTDELRTAGRRTSGIYADYDEGIVWHRILARRGWSVPHWPVEHGGTGWTPMQHYIFAAELAAAEAPPLAPIAVKMVAPVLIAFGTDEQKQRCLPGIRDGDRLLVPGLLRTGLRLRPRLAADPRGARRRSLRDQRHQDLDHARSVGRTACSAWCAPTRTAKPQRGITLPAASTWTRRASRSARIISISGDHELNQVFFDDVRVPQSSLVGKENDGWTVAKYLLEFERGGAWAPRLRARLRRLRRAADAAFAGLPGDSLERSDMNLKLADAECRIDAMQAMEMEALAAQARGEPPGGIGPSMNKILGTEMKQRITELGIEISGRHAVARVPMPECSMHDLEMSEEPVFNMSAYLNDRAASIYAGSNEVQRNIIAQQLLSGR